MTEQEWMICSEPMPMLQLLESKKNKRKLAMFGIACCRQISRLCSDERAIFAIDVAERHADRKATINEVRIANRDAREDARGIARPLGHYIYEIAVLWNATGNPFLLSEYALKAAIDKAGEKVLQCTLLREIFGNPFQRCRVSKRWLTPSVKQFCERIYADSAFESLHTLADALDETGCTNGDILAHCRLPGPHVRGCWVVDLFWASRERGMFGARL